MRVHRDIIKVLCPAGGPASARIPSSRTDRQPARRTRPETFMEILLYLLVTELVVPRQSRHALQPSQCSLAWPDCTSIPGVVARGGRNDQGLSPQIANRI